MEQHFVCAVCGARETWSSYRAAMAAAVWHVYLEHAQHWREVCGDRLPQDPLPTDLGRRLEPNPTA